MPNQHYQGDAFGKKVSRLRLWLRALRLAGEPYSYDIAVLASRECGDLSCLKGLNFPVKNIIAMDVDPGAVSTVCARFPEAKSFLGYAQDTLKSLKEQTGNTPKITYLDLCGTMTLTGLDTIKRVLGILSPGDILIVTLLKAREQDRVSVDNLEGEVLKSTSLGNFRSVISSLGSPPEKAINKKGWSACVRAATLTLSMGIVNRRGAYLNYVSTYFSKNENTGPASGSPMYTAMFTVGEVFDESEHYSRVHQSIEEAPVEVCDVITKSDLVECSYEVEKAFKESNLPYNVSECLNVAAGTLRAWRAHHKRGTYR